MANLRKAFANYWSTDIKLSKTQLSKMIQWGGFLGRLLKSITKNRITILIPLGLTAAASAADAGIHKKILGSGHNHPSSTTLIISNNEMEDIIKIVKSLEDSGLLLKGVTETVQNEVKEQKRGFLGMLLGTLGASLSGNILSGRGINRAGEGRGIVRAGYGNKKVEKTTKWIFNVASSFN